MNEIRIRGAREHNLKHVDLTLPHNQLIVVTGLSGSGKSSLAFDTVYAEGQRRYVESLSAYARQFLERLDKPEVESIEGLSPAIAIEQRVAGGNPRSTVATQTEIYDYLRVLFARVGVPHCPTCQRLISRQSAQEIVTHILRLAPNTSLTILAPLIRGRKGEYAELFREIKQQGFVRARVDGTLRDLDDPVTLDKKRAHTIEVVVDRLTLNGTVVAQSVNGTGTAQPHPAVVMTPTGSGSVGLPPVSHCEATARLTESVETALKIGKGSIVIATGHASTPRGTSTHRRPVKTAGDLIFSEQYACTSCGFSIEELSPRIFSFNSPYGACATCDGLGTKLEIDPKLVVPCPWKSLKDGAIEPWKRGGMHMAMYYAALLRETTRVLGIPLDRPFRSLERKVQRMLLCVGRAV